MTTEISKELAEILKEVIENKGEDFRLYRNYSGRCMYGRTCFGIVASNVGSIFADLVEGADEFFSKFYDEDMEPPHILRELARMMRLYRQDNMGHDVIVYFPDFTLPADFRIDGEDDEQPAAA
jgi:hypothetical protein